MHFSIIFAILAQNRDIVPRFYSFAFRHKKQTCVMHDSENFDRDVNMLGRQSVHFLPKIDQGSELAKFFFKLFGTIFERMLGCVCTIGIIG